MGRQPTAACSKIPSSTLGVIFQALSGETNPAIDASISHTGGWIPSGQPSYSWSHVKAKLQQCGARELIQTRPGYGHTAVLCPEEEVCAGVQRAGRGVLDCWKRRRVLFKLHFHQAIHPAITSSYPDSKAGNCSCWKPSPTAGLQPCVTPGLSLTHAGVPPNASTLLPRPHTPVQAHAGRALGGSLF